MSVAVTQGIKISVKPYYLPEESDPENDRYIFAYQITILNEGERPAQLVDRHWIIKNAFNQVEEVRGPGVVGYTPYLEPGESFTYQSYCPLSTAYGFMRGTYGMIRPDGERFEANIAPFVLMPQWMLN
jgi:ApaG protein